MFLFQGNECVLANIEKHKDIDAYDEANCGAIKRFMSIVAEDHFMEFINAQIASQSRDLKLVAGKAGQNAEKEGKSDFYNQPWVEDAIIRYLNCKPAAGNEPPGTT